MASYQDWKPIVFRAPAPTTSKPTGSKGKEKAVREALKRGDGVVTVKKATAGTNKTATADVSKLRAIDAETEDFHVDRVSVKLSTRIQQARVAKGWTQKDLALQINEKAAVINTYENGTAVPSPVVISKLSRALGVSLSGKPAKPKPKPAAKPAASPKPAAR